MPKKDARILSVGIILNGILYDLQLTDVLELYFIEDIYSFFMTGKLILFDRDGMFEFGPFVGAENDGVKVLYSTDDDEAGIELEFKIFKIEKSENAFGTYAGTSNVLTIILIDEAFFKFTRHKWSRSFKEKHIHEIVEHMSLIMGETPIDVILPTDQFYELWYMPRWDIATSIKWLMQRASMGDDCGYLFYTSTKMRKFTRHFVSIEELLKQGGLLEVDGDGGQYVFFAENIFKASKIKSWEITSIDEHARKYLQGNFCFGYDFERKKLIDSHEPLAPVLGETPGNSFIFYKDFIEKYVTVLGNKTLFHDISDPEADFINTGEDDEDIIKNYQAYDMIKRYNLQQLLIIIVAGHEDRYAGAMIEMEWPSFDKQEIYNRNLKGKYLIKSVTHSFQPKNTQCYTQKLVCIKNGYYDSFNNILEDAVKKNP